MLEVVAWRHFYLDGPPCCVSSLYHRRIVVISDADVIRMTLCAHVKIDLQSPSDVQPFLGMVPEFLVIGLRL